MRTATTGSRWSSYALLFLIIALAVSFIPTSARAQAVNTGNVAGQVTDPQGAVVPGVKITLSDPTTGSNYSGTTNNEGRYFIANVPPATYNMTAAKSGFATAKMSAQAVNVGSISTLDIQMTVGESCRTVHARPRRFALQ